MSYSYSLEFLSATNNQWSLVSVVDAINSTLSIVGCMKSALLSTAPTWINAQLPPSVWPVLPVTVPMVFVYEELVNGIRRPVEYPGTVTYSVLGVLTLACSHVTTATKLVGWKTTSLDFVRV